MPEVDQAAVTMVAALTASARTLVWVASANESSMVARVLAAIEVVRRARSINGAELDCVRAIYASGEGAALDALRQVAERDVDGRDLLAAKVAKAFLRRLN